LPALGSFRCHIAARDFARDDRGPELPLGPVVGRLDLGIVEASQQMGALLEQSILNLDVARLLHALRQQVVTPRLQDAASLRELLRRQFGMLLVKFNDVLKKLLA
jgi:hypothetical protein